MSLLRSRLNILRVHARSALPYDCSTAASYTAYARCEQTHIHRREHSSRFVDVMTNRTRQGKVNFFGSKPLVAQAVAAGAHPSENDSTLPVGFSWARSDPGLGASEFPKFIRTTSVFIDKSLFIKEFIESAPECTVILRPRRFGKSLNLSMLNSFLDRKQEDSSEIFRGLKIMGEQRIVSQHMGKYPVVHLSLKSCASSTWAGMRRDIWKSLFSMCKLHIGSRDSSLFGPEEEIRWTDLMQGKYLHSEPHILREDMDDYDLRDVFFNLVRRVWEFYGTRVIVSVDEYDAPLNVQFASEEDKRRRAEFFRGFYSAVLKDNPALRKALLVGVFEIRGESILSGLNNLKVLSIANDHVFGDCFGFTESEVKEFLQTKAEMAPKDVEHLWDKPGGIREYYNGYFVGGHKVINPWSFMNFLHEFKIGSYWTQTTSTNALFEAIKNLRIDFRDVFQSIEGLISEDKAVQKRIQVTELNPVRSCQAWERLSKDQFMHFMSMTGYLTYAPLDNGSGEVWIPNEEIRLEWKKLLANINGFTEFNQIKEHYEKLAEALRSFDEDSIKKFVEQAAQQVSNRHACKEHSYQLYIGGILSALNLTNSRSKCETGAGNGYSDQIINFDKDKRSVVIEYKRSTTSKNCLGDAKSGLKQIIETRYIDHVPSDHDVFLIGCGIWSKGPHVNVEMVTHTIFAGRRDLKADYTSHHPGLPRKVQ